MKHLVYLAVFLASLITQAHQNLNSKQNPSLVTAHNLTEKESHFHYSLELFSNFKQDI
ncbi:hypothetical protein [Formosa haliotis]|uniref:hypothetical protein n=1 Tax=Formosa haliotis TaxID=1555194 RepID=UPI0013562FFC|nr:hypothetical protein [Formosa haliotis]